MPVFSSLGQMRRGLLGFGLAGVLAGGGSGLQAKEVQDASASELRQRLTARVAEVQSGRDAAPVEPRPAPSRTTSPRRPAAASHRHAAASHEGHGHPHAAGHGAHWDYAGEVGPGAWGMLKPEFRQCSVGQRQSPIDIRGGIPVELTPIRFDYKPSGFNVVDNGHTVQVNVSPGNAIEVNGRRYDLVQFHFHRPSEERINGKAYDMVAHLVHKDLDGRLAVVAVLLEQGRSHPIVQQVWNNLPLERNEAMPGEAAMELASLLPEDRRYYTYMGSLTTPPCTEGVLWLVMKQPVQLSPEQVGVFARLYPMNARPVQPAQGRMIKESN